MVLSKTEYLGKAKLPNVTAYAIAIKNSKDILIEFYIGISFYRKEIVKPGHFWHTWFTQEIENKDKLTNLRSNDES